MSSKKCRLCEKVLEETDNFFYKNSSGNLRGECKKCNNKMRKERYKDGRYYIYYLPNENRAGVSERLEDRIRRHGSEGLNIDDWIVLCSFSDKKEAVYHEALFQSVLAMEGLNLNIYGKNDKNE